MNQHGTSLIGVLVAMGVAAILILGIAHSISSVYSAMSKFKSMEEASYMSIEITDYYKVSANCTNSFAGQTLDITNNFVSATHSTNDIVLQDINTTGLQIVGSNWDTYQYGSTKIDKLKFSLTSNIAPDFYLGRLYVFPKSNEKGIPIRPKPIPLRFQFQPGTGIVINCKVPSPDDSTPGGGGSGGAPPTGNYLVNMQHTDAQCTALNGTVETDPNGELFCRFSRSSCPAGWARYFNWSTTEPNTGSQSATATGCSDMDGGQDVITVTGTCTINNYHAWSNTPVEVKTNCTIPPINGNNCNFPSSNFTIRATVTERGCY